MADRPGAPTTADGKERMAATALPLTYDLTVYTGTTFKATFVWYPDGVTAQDFTGWSARMYVGPSQGAAVLTLTTADGDIALSAQGQIAVHIAPSHTAMLKAGTYAYVLDLIEADATVTRFLRGGMRVIKDVGP